MMVSSVILTLSVALSVALLYGDPTLAQMPNYCSFELKTIGKTCLGGPINQGISEADKQLILRTHNDYRNRVAKGLETRGSPGPQPSASNMRQLTWDDDLAKWAQVNANQCVYTHDSLNCPNKNFPKGYGQNIAEKTGGMFGSRLPSNSDPVWDQFKKADWANVPIKLWYEEVKDFSNSIVRAFRSVAGPVTGHYTQLIWAETSRIGCGFTSYPSKQPGFFTTYYVCNYGPRGNTQGMGFDVPVYKIGPPASSCPQGTKQSKEYDGLCL